MAYVGLFLKGTANQVLINAGSGTYTQGNMILTLPQSIATTSTVEFGNLSLGCGHVNTLDVNGGVAIGAYAGVEAIGTGVLAVSGQIIAGTYNPTTGTIFDASTTGPYAYHSTGNPSTADGSGYQISFVSGAAFAPAGNVALSAAFGSLSNYLPGFGVTITIATQFYAPTYGNNGEGTITAAYGGYFATPTAGTTNAGIYAGSIECGTTGHSPPTGGAIFNGRALFGTTTDDTAHAIQASGGILTDTIKITTGASAGYILSSSSVGVGSWEATTSITALGTITTGVWEGTLVGGTYGGTGVNNGSSTITIGDNITFSGAYTFTGTLTGATSVTFPTSGTLATTGATVASIAGTANEITASESTGAVTLSIPVAFIAPGSIEATTSLGVGTTAPSTSGNATISGTAFIGTTTSIGTSDVLQVLGALSVGTTAASTTGVLRLVSAGSANYIQSGLSASSGSDAPLLFTNMNAGTEWMRLTGTGWLGIGTNAPSGILDIQSGASAGSSVYGTLLRSPLSISGTGTATTAVYIAGTHTINGSGSNYASWLQIAPACVATSTISALYGIEVFGATGSGTVTQAYSVYINTPAIGSAVTALYSDNASFGYTGANLGAGQFIVSGATSLGTATFDSVGTKLTVNGASSSKNIINITGTLQTYASGNSQNGIFLQPVFNPTSGVTYALGMQALCNWIAPTGETISNAYTFYGYNTLSSNVGTITNSAVFYADTGSSAGGTVTYVYGAYLNLPTAGATSNCALYADNASFGYNQVSPGINNVFIKGGLAIGKASFINTSGVEIYNRFFVTTNNTTTYPGSDNSNGGLAVSWNFQNGNAEVDFWNIYNSAGNAFAFYQKTGTSAATKVLEVSGTGLLRVPNGAIATAPPASSTATAAFGTALTLGTAVQNSTGYDLLVSIFFNIGATASAVVSAGVGTTSSPTTETIMSGMTGFAGFLTYSFYVPNNYYLLVSYTGTFTASNVMTAYAI